MMQRSSLVLLLLLILQSAFGQTDPNDFVLLNIEMLSRAETGQVLQEVNKAQPKLVALNVFYGSDRGASDDPMVQAFSAIETDILGYNLKDKRLGSHSKFMQHAADSGMTRLVGDVRMWPMYFVPKQNKFGQLHDHFSMTVASYLIDELPDYKPDGIKAIEYFPKLDYTIINMSEFDLEKHGELIKGNVVFVGYLGPENEDKQFTPLRETKGVSEGQKDTYGTEILVYMVRTIISDSKQP
ncbi:MAG: CHASE2 domain-containing protein [Cyclobacteriaceae bacterium]